MTAGKTGRSRGSPLLEAANGWMVPRIAGILPRGKSAPRQCRSFRSSHSSERAGTEAEIRDDLECTLHEYERGMKRRHLALVNTAVATILIPAVDIIADPS